MSDDVKMPSMDAAMLTALTPSLEPTGEHKALPDGYCPDCCGAPCIKTWLKPERPECVQCGAPVKAVGRRYRTGAVTCRDCHDADFA